MKPREAAGCINRAKAVYVFVFYGPDVEEPAEGEEAPDGGCYIQVPKSAAKELCDDAKEQGCEMTIEVKGREVYIG
jgi:hypothetical protein